MLRLVVFYLFALLLALQSFVAAADTHGLHQGSDQQVNFDSGQDLDERGVSIDQDDCQHCCHCHGSNFFLASNNNHLNTQGMLDAQNLARNNYLSQLVDPDSRPPIV